jgi:hypothetical protein
MVVVPVGIEFVEDAPDAVGKAGFLEVDAELVFGNLAQDGDGVVPEVLPAAGGEPLEKVLGFLVPAPPQITGQFVQVGDQLVLFGACQWVLHNSCENCMPWFWQWPVLAGVARN